MAVVDSKVAPLTVTVESWNNSMDVFHGGSGKHVMSFQVNSKLFTFYEDSFLHEHMLMNNSFKL